jgi:hypothetical protein
MQRAYIYVFHIWVIAIGLALIWRAGGDQAQTVRSTATFSVRQPPMVVVGDVRLLAVTRNVDFTDRSQRLFTTDPLLTFRRRGPRLSYRGNF